MKKKNTKKVKKGVSKGEKRLPSAFRLQSKCFFLTYKGISDSGQKITKKSLANFLLRQNPNEPKVRPEKYLVCQQMYDSGEPHFHAILIYPTRKNIQRQDFYDFLGIHPNIQKMRNMKAALEYVYKQDTDPHTNMDIVQQKRVARAKDSSSLYQLLQQQMLKDPFRFDIDDYCATHNIDRHIYKANFSKAITLLKRMQPAYARKTLKQNKNGIELITPTLIQQNLNEAQLAQFYSHPCYQKVIDHVNEIHKYPNKDQSTQAPLKTRHLLLVGGPDIGKTSLVYHRANSVDPYPGLAHYYPTYYLSIGEKYFPPYRSYDYALVNWQQFSIVSDMFPKSGYNRLLNYLDGSVSALPQKGRPPVERQDNPKHILTSNLGIKGHVLRSFKSPQNRAMALRNLPARVEEVKIPQGKSIHFLRKLFLPLRQG